MEAEMAGIFNFIGDLFFLFRSQRVCRARLSSPNGEKGGCNSHPGHVFSGYFLSWIDRVS